MYRPASHRNAPAALLVATLALGLAAGCTDEGPSKVLVSAITLSPAAPSVAVGQSLTLTATGVRNNTPDPLTDCLWTVADSATLSLSGSGGKLAVKGLRVGSTKVTASARGLSASVVVQ